MRMKNLFISEHEKIEFIKELKKTENLWNIHLSNFKSTFLRNVELDLLATKFNRSIDQIKEMVKQIREDYRRKRNKILQSRIIGHTFKDVPAWYIHASFLKDTLTPRKKDSKAVQQLYAKPEKAINTESSESTNEKLVKSAVESIKPENINGNNDKDTVSVEGEIISGNNKDNTVSVIEEIILGNSEDNIKNEEELQSPKISKTIQNDDEKKQNKTNQINIFQCETIQSNQKKENETNPVNISISKTSQSDEKDNKTKPINILTLKKRKLNNIMHDFNNSIPKKIELDNDNSLIKVCDALKSVSESLVLHTTYKNSKYDASIENFGEYVKSELNSISNEELREDAKHQINLILYAIKRKERNEFN